MYTCTPAEDIVRMVHPKRHLEDGVDEETFGADSICRGGVL